MKKFWISWYCPLNNPFTLNFPWWISGYTWDKEDNEIDIICSAIKSYSEDQAKEMIRSCYDKYDDKIEFRFVSEKSDDWIPYCDRFPKAEWMEF